MAGSYYAVLPRSHGLLRGCGTSRVPYIALRSFPTTFWSPCRSSCVDRSMHTFSPRVSRKERALHFHHLGMSLWSFPPFAATCNAICTEVRQGLPTNNSSSRSPESTLCATYRHRIFGFILHILFTYTRFAFENYRLLSISASCLFAYEYEFSSIFFEPRHLFLL